MPWLQLKIHSSRERAGAVEDALLASGAVSITLQDAADQPILEPALGEMPLWNHTIVTGLFDAELNTGTAHQQLSQALPEFAAQLRWEQLEDKDWQREWMQYYHPIHCGGSLWICPSWIAPPDPNATNLLLDPGLAFGTGTHPTTLLCLQWLAEQTVRDFHVLDYGCGSGILGIAAYLLGATFSNAVDIDPQALLATADNAQRNSLPNSALATYLPNALPQQQHQLVFANILAGPLVELAPRLTTLTAPGGWLCLSGILDSQVDAVTAAYQTDFEIVAIREKDHWVQIAARKRAA